MRDFDIEEYVIVVMPTFPASEILLENRPYFSTPGAARRLPFSLSQMRDDAR
jgi:hypothetical protein